MFVSNQEKIEQIVHHSELLHSIYSKACLCHLHYLLGQVYFLSEAPITYVRACTYYTTIFIWDFNQGFPPP